MAQNSPSDQVQAWVTAAKNKDADSVSKLYTTDAVLCATEGIIKGQSNIKDDFAAQFKAGWTLTNITNETDNVRTEWGWSYGSWSGTFPNPQPPPTTLDVQGSWSVVWVLQGGTWLMQQQSIITNPPQ
jgi:ketosteroid isomerase-like protein